MNPLQETTKQDPVLPLEEAMTCKPTRRDDIVANEKAAPLQQFGRYSLLRQLGEGGMGIVYLAHDTMLDRPVALKIPHREMLTSPAVIERFYREARAAAQLDHPGICRVHDVGSFEEQPYITMAFIEGKPLSQHVEELVREPRRAAELLHQVALALAEAHERGIVHRDLKPANIMLDRRGKPVIMDFGLARLETAPAADRTGQGVVMGTPAYMSPEQANGDSAAIGPASDLYSLGVILYELLTGQTPFSGSFMQILLQVVAEPPVPPSTRRAEVDPILEAICLKAMAKEANQRFASAKVLAAALEDYLAGRLAPEVTLAAASPTQRTLDLVLRELLNHGWEIGLPRILSWLPTVRELSEEARNALLLWLQGSLEAEEVVEHQFADALQRRALKAWIQLGRAYQSFRDNRREQLREFLEHPSSSARGLGSTLEAELAYLRGLQLTQEGRWEESLPTLHLALEKVGGEHHLTGRILLSLGRAQASKCHAHAATEFFQQALRRMEGYADEPGLLVGYEALGQHHLEWDQPDLAEEVLSAGLRLAHQRRDVLWEARFIQELGQVMLRRGEEASAHGKKAAAAKRYRQASDYFVWAIRALKTLGTEQAVASLTCSCQALLRLYENDLNGAADYLRQAEVFLQHVDDLESRAKWQRVRARWLHATGETDEAINLLRQALRSYDQRGLSLKAARTQLELARLLASAEVPHRLIFRAYRDAVLRAEDCGHDTLIHQIDEELESIDEEGYWRLVFERVRCTAAPLFSSSLHEGISEVLTIVCLELGDFDNFCRGQEPQTVLQTLNQLLAEFEDLLQRQQGHITNYQAAGFIGLVREANHAERAVQAALELRARVAEFNRPRQPLGLPVLPARIGVATGPVFLGNLGTYRYLCFTPVGPVVNFACSLSRQADPQAPCISQETYDHIRDRFLYQPDSPRQVEVTAVGIRRVWDVADRVRAGSRLTNRPG